MANPMIPSEICPATADDDEDECQLVSFTNKLPYYVRHIHKTNHRNKPTSIVAKIREYSTRESILQLNDEFQYHSFVTCQFNIDR